MHIFVIFFFVLFLCFGYGSLFTGNGQIRPPSPDLLSVSRKTWYVNVTVGWRRRVRLRWLCSKLRRSAVDGAVASVEPLPQ